MRGTVSGIQTAERGEKNTHASAHVRKYAAKPYSLRASSASDNEGSRVPEPRECDYKDGEKDVSWDKAKESLDVGFDLVITRARS